jgi:aminoglycoside phosphotransferase (APT) family kinase protein
LDQADDASGDHDGHGDTGHRHGSPVENTSSQEGSKSIQQSLLSLVLRKKPAVVARESAHALHREFRALRALQQ